MSFLNPLAFWGFSLILIPIIIHLFNFRRAKTLYFSNVAFLNTVKAQSNSKNTLRKLLILLLRVLAIIFLVIAFAQPVLVQSGNADDSTFSAFYLDNSQSMGARSGNNIDLLSEGMGLLQSLVASYPQNLRFSFLTNNLQEHNRGIIVKRLEDELSEVELTNRSEFIQNIMSKLDRMDDGVNRVSIISDFQKSTMKGLPEVLEDTSRNFELYKLKSLGECNLYIDSVKLDNPIGFPNQNKLQVLVRNIGEASRDEILVKVYRNEKQISSFTKGFKGNTSNWLDIELAANAELQGLYAIDIRDNDFIFDNRYYFVINDFTKARVYQLYDDVATPAIKSVFANKSYFDFVINPISQVESENLLKADLIILDQLETLPEWLRNQLIDYKSTILLLPNQSPDYESYSKFLGRKVRANTDTTRYSVSVESLKHPLFAGIFKDKSNETTMPWVQTNIALPAGQNDVILKTSLNQPLFIEAKGNVFLLNGPLSDRSTNLHKHGLFLPLMYQLSMANRESPRLAYSTSDELIPMQNDSLLLTETLRLKSEANVIVPMLRNSNGNTTLEIPSGMVEPGFYFLVNQLDTLKVFAFNQPEMESDTRVLSDQEIREMIAGRDHVKFESVDNVRSYSEKLAMVNEGVPLWKYALLLALIFLITELTLLRVFR